MRRSSCFCYHIRHLLKDKFFKQLKYFWKGESYDRHRRLLDAVFI